MKKTYIKSLLILTISLATIQLTSCDLFQSTTSSTTTTTSQTTTNTTSTSTSNTTSTSTSTPDLPQSKANPNIKSIKSQEENNYKLAIIESTHQLTSKPSNFNIYAVTDVHGKIDYQSKSYVGLAQLDYYIKQDKNYHSTYSILISDGDMYQGYGISNYYNGEPMVDVFNTMGMISNTIGNHEFDWGIDTLVNISKYSTNKNGYVTLGANIRENNDESKRIENIYDAAIYDMGVFKVGVVGVIGQVENSISTKALGNYKFNTQTHRINNLGNYLKNTKNCDIVVLSSHDSIESAFIRNLANDSQSPFSCIFGGHSHQLKDNKENNVPYLQPKADSNAYSVAPYTLSGSTYTLNTSKAGSTQLYSNEQISEELLSKDIVNYINSIDRTFLSKVIANCDFGMYRYPKNDEENLMIFILKAMYNKFIKIHPEIDKNHVVTIHNNGGVRGDIQKGKITINSIYTISPFDNRVVYFTRSGDKVYNQTALNLSNSYYCPTMIQNDSSVNYTVVTIDYLTTNANFSDLYNENNGGSDIKTDGTSYYIRDLIIDYITEDLNGVISRVDCRA